MKNISKSRGILNLALTAAILAVSYFGSVGPSQAGWWTGRTGNTFCKVQNAVMTCNHL